MRRKARYEWVRQKREADYELLRMLEARRLSHDAAMWQAPTLTVLSQTFLLVILSDSSVRFTVAAAAALAGWITLFVAALVLLQLRDRERHFSDRIEALTQSMRIENPARLRCKRQRLWQRTLDWNGRMLWLAVFLAFAAADLVALVWTHCRT